MYRMTERDNPDQMAITASTPADEQKCTNPDSSGRIIAPIRQPLFIATPVLKAGRTRAWRSLQVYPQEEVEASSPSYSFVRLRVNPEALKQSGIPVIKTRWEEKLVQRTEPEEKVQLPLLIDEVERLDQDALDKGKGKGMDDRRAMHLSPGDMVDTKESSEPLTNQNWEPRHQGCAKVVPGDASKAHVTTHFDLLSHNQFVDNIGLSELSVTSLLPDQVSSRVSGEKNTTISTAFPEDNSRGSAGESQAGSVQKPSRRKGHSADHITDSIFHQEPAPKRRFVRYSVTGDSGTLTLDDEEDLTTKNQLEPVKSVAGVNKAFQQLLSPTRAHNTDLLNPRQAIFKGHSDTLPRTTRSATTADTLRHPKESIPVVEAMAPVRDPNNVESSLKDAIQKLYEVQSQVHGFVPETQPLLVEKMTELAQSLAHIQTLTSPTLSPNNPIHKNRVAPEVIDYVDDSRNPDIYNREFVELVQRGNAVMNGKQKAFKDFSLIFADALRKGIPELSDDVDRIMDKAGFLEKKADEPKAGADVANGGTKTEKK